MIKCFFLRNKDESYPVPEVGLLGGLGIDKYLNSSRPSGEVEPPKSYEAVQLGGNVIFGNKLDASGYLEVIAMKDIPAGGELLVDYRIQDCRRQSRPKDDGVVTCRCCWFEIIPGTEGVINVECYCTDSRWSHLECAKKWHAKRAIINLMPHNRKDESPRQIWQPSISVVCDICEKKLSDRLIYEITQMLANGRKSKIRDVANQILSKKKVLVNTTIVQSDNWSTSKKRKGLDKCGFLSNKKAQFYMDDDKKWIHGCIHEYVSAAKRKQNRCSCEQGKECSCPNLRRGFYRYTFRNQFGEVEEDYFSDEDDTVRVNGLSGSDLWG
eukprot:CAMPEP_0176499844 /NCGR_PEP_ID=MMETSP0200_2-20121128/13176_1 /TAXON_ID=947934 /ORGANISM="Chaetoceros sp., Strain GSL56" /LENGTH=324 /DNA_ID=CAMNT_0017898355 /DNA_START=534 /DNA_END=1508 /DNA_ORIENTATION=+